MANLNELLKGKRHGLSIAFCEASPQAKADLRESILERGYDPMHPIVLYEGKVLDGWHRLQTCIELNVEPVVTEFEGDTQAALRFVFAQNMARRQMTQSQIALAFVYRNQYLPEVERLNAVEVSARSGLKSTRKVQQLIRLDEVSHDVALDVASGGKQADRAIREVLKEEPADKKETVFVGSFTCRSKKLVENFDAARVQSGWTVTKATNKALQLFVDAAMEGDLA